MTAAFAIGPYPIRPPVVLAPMAGITNIAFRRLCREQSRAATGSHGGLYVGEMITTQALVERNPRTMRMLRVRSGGTPSQCPVVRR